MSVWVYYFNMNKIAEFIKTNRKAAGFSQKEFAALSGLGLRFVRDLEQGKETVRMDKVNQALAMFGMTAVPGKIDGNIEQPRSWPVSNVPTDNWHL